MDEEPDKVAAPMATAPMATAPDQAPARPSANNLLFAPKAIKPNPYSYESASVVPATQPSAIFSSQIASEFLEKNFEEQILPHPQAHLDAASNVQHFDEKRLKIYFKNSKFSEPMMATVYANLSSENMVLYDPDTQEVKEYRVGLGRTYWGYPPLESASKSSDQPKKTKKKSKSRTKVVDNPLNSHAVDLDSSMFDNVPGLSAKSFSSHGNSSALPLESRHLRVAGILARSSHTEAEWRDIFSEMNDTRNVKCGSRLAREKLAPERRPSPELKHQVKQEVKEQKFEKILVRFQDESYLHVSWEDERDVTELVRWRNAAEKRGVKVKLRNLKRDVDNGTKARSADIYGETCFNPEYQSCERLLDVWTSSQGQKWVFVKWAALPYDSSTWELEADVSNFCDCSKMLEELFERNKVPNESMFEADSKALASLLRKQKKRPKNDAQALDENHVFKDNHELRKYQIEAVNWLYFNYTQKRNSVLADEMGLGKTCQSVAFSETLRTVGGVPGPVIVVAPLATLPHWQREFSGWTGRNTVVYHGNETAKFVINKYELFHRDPQTDLPLESWPKIDVLVTNFESAVQDADTLGKISWSLLIVDEAHRLKNVDSRINETLRLKYKFQGSLLLTGTPIQNNIAELWTLLNFTDPKKFKSVEDFEERFGNMRTNEELDDFHAELKPYFLRRFKRDVESALPIKEETIVDVEMTLAQKAHYRALYEQNTRMLMTGVSAGTRVSLMNVTMELRKCCLHPYLCSGVEERILSENPFDVLQAIPDPKERTPANVHKAELAHSMELLVKASGKMVLLDKLLPKIQAQGSRVLVFSQMTRMLDILEDYLRFRLYGYERIDGNVPIRKRQAAIDRFSSKGSRSLVFLLSTRGCGQGINLTAADVVVLFDSDWNPQNDMQAQARCHRIGQKKDVSIYRFVTRKTYEQEMFLRASKKLGLDQAIMSRLTNSGVDPSYGSAETSKRGFDDGSGGRMNDTELERLLKRGAYALTEDEEKAKEEANAFCDADIDTILSKSRRVRYAQDGTEERTLGGEVVSRTSREDVEAASSGNRFKTATFVTADSGTVDVDDPDFWTKTVGLEKPEELLKPVQFGVDGELLKDEEDLDIGRRKRRAAARTKSSGELDAETEQEILQMEREDYGVRNDRKRKPDAVSQPSRPKIKKQRKPTASRRRDRQDFGDLNYDGTEIHDMSAAWLESLLNFTVSFGLGREEKVREMMMFHDGRTVPSLNQIRMLMRGLAIASATALIKADSYGALPDIGGVIITEKDSGDLVFRLMASEAEAAREKDRTDFEHFCRRFPILQKIQNDLRPHLAKLINGYDMPSQFIKHKFAKDKLQRRAVQTLDFLDECDHLSFAVEQLGCGKKLPVIKTTTTTAVSPLWTCEDDFALLKHFYEVGWDRRRMKEIAVELISSDVKFPFHALTDVFYQYSNELSDLYPMLQKMDPLQKPQRDSLGELLRARFAALNALVPDLGHVLAVRLGVASVPILNLPGLSPAKAMHVFDVAKMVTKSFPPQRVLCERLKKLVEAVRVSRTNKPKSQVKKYWRENLPLVAAQPNMKSIGPPPRDRSGEASSRLPPYFTHIKKSFKKKPVYVPSSVSSLNPQPWVGVFDISPVDNKPMIVSGAAGHEREPPKSSDPVFYSLDDFFREAQKAGKTDDPDLGVEPKFGVWFASAPVPKRILKIVFNRIHGAPNGAPPCVQTETPPNTAPLPDVPTPNPLHTDEYLKSAKLPAGAIAAYATDLGARKCAVAKKYAVERLGAPPLEHKMVASDEEKISRPISVFELALVMGYQDSLDGTTKAIAAHKRAQNPVKKKVVAVVKKAPKRKRQSKGMEARVASRKRGISDVWSMNEIKGLFKYISAFGYPDDLNDVRDGDEAPEYPKVMPETELFGSHTWKKLRDEANIKKKTPEFMRDFAFRSLELATLVNQMKPKPQGLNDSEELCWKILKEGISNRLELRIRLLRLLRVGVMAVKNEGVLKNTVNKVRAVLKTHEVASMPIWWGPDQDLAMLRGISVYGIGFGKTNWVPMLNDPKLPYAGVMVRTTNTSRDAEHGLRVITSPSVMTMRFTALVVGFHLVPDDEGAEIARKALSAAGVPIPTESELEKK